jgi:hypothetical protein
MNKKKLFNLIFLSMFYLNLCLFCSKKFIPLDKSQFNLNRSNNDNFDYKKFSIPCLILTVGTIEIINLIKGKETYTKKAYKITKKTACDTKEWFKKLFKKEK